MEVAHGLERDFLRIVEDITDKKEKIYIILTTGGGSAVNFI